MSKSTSFLNVDTSNTADDPVAPQTVWESLSATELPRLWLPGRNNLFQIDALPILGTGKTDLSMIKRMAAEKADE